MWLNYSLGFLLKSPFAVSSVSHRCWFSCWRCYSTTIWLFITQQPNFSLSSFTACSFSCSISLFSFAIFFTLLFIILAVRIHRFVVVLDLLIALFSFFLTILKLFLVTIAFIFIHMLIFIFVFFTFIFISLSWFL